MKEIKLLFVTANPEDSERLNLDEELREVVNTLEGESVPIPIRLIPCPAARPRDLADRLTRLRPEIVHFACLGQEDKLILLSDDRKSLKISSEALTHLFRQHSDHVRLVFINTNTSDSLVQSISTAIPFVIGHNKPLWDRDAVALASWFYRGLSVGYSILEALEHAKLFGELSVDCEPRLYSSHSTATLNPITRPLEPTKTGDAASPKHAANESNEERWGLRSQPRRGIFISYSHRDRQWLDRLKSALRPFERLGALYYWDDTRIRPGEVWKQEIENALNDAEAAILLVSQDFLASDFINDTELPALLKAAKVEGLRIFWIPVRPSAYDQTEIAQFQAATDPGTPLSTLDKPKQEQAMVDFARQLQEILSDSIVPGNPGSSIDNEP